MAYSHMIGPRGKDGLKFNYIGFDQRRKYDLCV